MHQEPDSTETCKMVFATLLYLSILLGGWHMLPSDPQHHHTIFVHSYLNSVILYLVL